MTWTIITYLPRARPLLPTVLAQAETAQDCRASALGIVPRATARCRSGLGPLISTPALHGLQVRSTGLPRRLTRSLAS
jgi:hypothetical protein